VFLIPLTACSCSRPHAPCFVRYGRVVRVVLEDGALDGVYRDGELVAYTSARLVAEHLAIDPGTAATALRMLRRRGFLELSQTTGPSGRFGLAAYTLYLPDGVEVVDPERNRPCPAAPHTDPAETVPVVGRRRATPAATQSAFDLGFGPSMRAAGLACPEG
jgi:hypothetical protein